MAEIKESAEREYYRYKCKHYGDGSGICYLFSGWSANHKSHITIGCTANAKCRRMRNYDKKHKDNAEN
jgi:hypothetical protein